jgi:hypothetical protein
MSSVRKSERERVRERVRARVEREQTKNRKKREGEKEKGLVVVVVCGVCFVFPSSVLKSRRAVCVNAKKTRLRRLSWRSEKRKKG